MLAKKKERGLAYKMRREGFSLLEISGELNVSKSSVSLWTRDVLLSKQAQKRLHQRSLNGRKRSQEVLRARTQAKLKEASLYAVEVLRKVSLDVNYIQIICALIYWCEGEKSKNDATLAFTNSDPSLMATFVNLLREGFEIDESKFRMCIHLHDYHNREQQLHFWSRVVNLPESQFMRPYRKQHTGKQKRKNYAGCASIRYYDTHLARRIQAIAREFLKQYG